MTTTVRIHGWQQTLVWVLAGLFVLGFFFSPVGAWTGPIIGVWLVGTQRPWRGFLWILTFSFIPDLMVHWRSFPLTGPASAFQYLGWMLLAALLGVTPFTLHRLISPRLPGLLSTLPLSMAGVTIHTLALPLLHMPGIPIPASQVFLSFWFAATMVWMWTNEFRRSRIAVGVRWFAVLYTLAAGFWLLNRFSGARLSESLPHGGTLAWLCLGGLIVLGAWALLRPTKRRTWADRPEALVRLQSPCTGNPLRVFTEKGREALVSRTGERFPIRRGIPDFRRPEDLTGDNLKYNHVYQTIGGFYDDIQRVFCALAGFDRNAYFHSYMDLLEVKPGDSVLETSVGTGLNFKYLPTDVKLFGLDLSPEMLANCQLNLRRWQMDADLYLGNAETLPFADSSFDVVFHVGGINFFNDRAKAIQEMIRVAKPGSLLLIADETEKHVKQVYEKSPGGLWKNRKAPVSAPGDLVPAEMQDIRLEQVRNGDTYTLTFRKPAIA